jgi:two-component system sensor kinase FixL
MGIGLAVCKRIIDAHGGRIWASPRPEGGTDFTFSLPATREARD